MQIFGVAFKYLKKYPARSISVICLIILSSLFEGASFGMLIPLIQVMTGTGNGVFQNATFTSRLFSFFGIADQARQILLIFCALFLTVIAKNLFTYLMNVLIAKMRFMTTRDLSANLMDRLIEYDLRYFDSVKSGHIISNMTNETRRMGDFLLNVLSLLALSAKVSAYIILLLLISWQASIAIIALVAVVLFPIELVMKKLKKLSSAASHVLADYGFKLVEILGGIRVIKGVGSEGAEKANFRAKADAIYRVNYDSTKYASLLMPLSEAVVFGLVVLCILVLMVVVKIDVSRTFPYLATYLLVLVKALTQLNQMNGVRTRAMYDIAAFDSYEKLYDRTGKATINSGGARLERFCDAIEFRDVGFSYSGDKMVLRHINLRIPGGKVTAIVGASGVGKSTLVNLIMRFYDIGSGSITVDGVDLKELELHSWRKKIGFVSQDIFIFNMSISDNIVYGHPGTSREKIVDAAKAAGAHDFIMALPNKYDTLLGERGVRLSGGQKQRVSIARAIIHDPEILILDEATSSLDTETEKLIKDAIDRLAKDRTVIAIAHRLSTIVHADNIIVLHEGGVEDHGLHSELILRNGLYKRLYNAQFVR
jgi:ABC-type multidrug transport system fused ATPase/permease subunit